jgi:hypothetical protein
MGTVTKSLIHLKFEEAIKPAVGCCSHYIGSGCWLLFPSFSIRLLVTVPIILDQVVGYCSHYFGSSCRLLFQSFWIRLLVTVPIILDQAFGSITNRLIQNNGNSNQPVWFKLMGMVTNSLIQNNRNSNQQPDPKSPVQAVGYCSNHSGSGFWLLFPLFWIRLLVTVPIFLEQAVGYCSHYF